jgi:hypothetical protein
MPYNAGADHLRERVLGGVRVAGVVEGSGEDLSKPDALVELADGEQSGVAGELAWRWVNDERRGEKVEALGPDTW